MISGDSIVIVAADVTREGLIVHFSDHTTSLFSPAFLYASRSNDGNAPLLEQGEIVQGSPLAAAIKER